MKTPTTQRDTLSMEDEISENSIPAELLIDNDDCWMVFSTFYSLIQN